MPAFAIIAHKVQGQMMKLIIADLDTCSRTESPYVMISRIHCLEDLTIVQPFNFKQITCQPSEDTQKEYNKLQLCNLQTMLTHGMEEEQTYAQQILSSCDGTSILNVAEAKKNSRS